MDAAASHHATTTTFVARCPCGSSDLVPCNVVQASAGHVEDVPATHECKGCGRRFRVVPPRRSS